MSPTPAASVARIILVDDNDDDLTLAEMFLRKAGAQQELVVFASGNAAQQQLGASTPTQAAATAAIFIDVKMPGLTGLELLEWLRSRPEYAAVPVIMCSSSDDPGDIARAARGGAQAYLAKHPKVPVLREILSRLTERRPGETLSIYDFASNLLKAAHPAA